jgi:hypothetical protein
MLIKVIQTRIKRLLFGTALLFALPAVAQDGWLAMVSATQAEQPHWVTPVVTVTPRLEQEIRFDFSHQSLEDNLDLWNIGGGKGVELIPAKRLEVIIGVPPYFVRDNPKSPDGWGDESFLLKYRIASANEEHGNYIVTAFVAGSINSGQYKNGAPASSITPTISAGKGFGRFDVQSTFGLQLPVDAIDEIGHPAVWNSAFQYKLDHHIWPELEVNSIFYNGGKNDGKKQTFLTPGLVLGRFPIHNRVGFTFGIGEQIAVTQFKTYNHNLVLTARLPF